MATAIDHTADGSKITQTQVLHFRSDGRDASDDFMPRYTRILGAMPFIAGGMQIRVTDPTEENLNLNIIRIQPPPWDGQWRQLRLGGHGAKGFVPHVELLERLV